MNQISSFLSSRSNGERRKTARITVSLSQTQHSVLSRLAAKNDVSLSWITRRALQDYIQNNDAQPLSGKKKTMSGG